MSQNHKEVTASVILAVDKLGDISALQQLLDIALEQLESPSPFPDKHARTQLLLNCYLEQVRQPLQDLQMELKALQQLNRNSNAASSPGLDSKLSN